MKLGLILKTSPKPRAQILLPLPGNTFKYLPEGISLPDTEQIQIEGSGPSFQTALLQLSFDHCYSAVIKKILLPVILGWLGKDKS